MAKPKPSALEFLLQVDVIGEFLPKIGRDQWQTLYFSADDPPHRFGMWCALLAEEAAARAIGHDSWDLMIGDGKPGFSQSWPDGTEVTTYHRFGSRDGVRPLVRFTAPSRST